MSTSFQRLLLIGCALGALLVLPGAASAADTNHDGISDAWEVRHNLSLSVNQAGRDQDSDGLKNLYEYRSASAPRDRDSDDDGVRDYGDDTDGDSLANGQEQRARTHPNRDDSDGDGTADSEDNQDSDGLENEEEFEVGSNPRDGDSDDDGTSDSAEDEDGDGLCNEDEFALGEDPSDSDSDDDGTLDGDELGGVVVSFDGTTLAIQLADGTTTSMPVAVDAVIEIDDVEGAGNGDSVAGGVDSLVAGAVIAELELDDFGTAVEIEIAGGSDLGEVEDDEIED